jgi:hypothetical protein
MVRIDGTLECDWCYLGATWGIETSRGHRDLCQTHYDDVVRELRAETLRGLSGEALSICQDFHAWQGRGVVIG